MSRDIKFATFNLYNLQLPDKKWRGKVYSQDEYNKKIEWSASTLKLLDADVIAFQELWSGKCLVDVFEKAELSKKYKLIFIKDTWQDSWYDIAVAAAVREPWIVDKKILHKLFPEEFKLIKRKKRVSAEDDDIEVSINMFSRTVLQLSIKNKEHSRTPAIQVFAAHLKSRLATQLDYTEKKDEKTKKHSQSLGGAISTIRRTAEAAALRIILCNTMKNSNTPVVLLGDLNDSQLSNTLNLVSGQPPYRLFASSGVAGKSDVGLYSAGNLQEFRSLRDVYYTHNHKGIRETLDHILVSEQFYDYSKNRIWSFRNMRIWNDYVEDEDTSTSDHGVVCAEFDYKPA